ncbi:uncharacterized protein PEZ65_018350 [Lycodopsis pacificus]
MSRVQKIRVFVTQRLNAALEDILGVLEKTIVQYEEEAALSREVISRQHALLCALHKPLMELPSADAFTQQLIKNQEVPPEHQDQEGEQLLDLDEADIIQFTFSAGGAARSDEDLDLSAARTARVQPGACGPDQEVHLVSSETEDSEDYSKDSTDTRSAPDQQKPKITRRPAGPSSCRVCSRTFKTRRFLIHHLRAHLKDSESVCGLCGERFESTQSLKIHIQTHRTPRRRTGDLENQTGTRSQQPESSRKNLSVKKKSLRCESGEEGQRSQNRKKKT